MEPERGAGMPAALGRGGTGKAKVALGMMNKEEPDPACPCGSQWACQASGEEAVGGA